MATHSSVLAWRIPGTGEPGGLPLWGRTESDTTEATRQQQQQQQNEDVEEGVCEGMNDTVSPPGGSQIRDYVSHSTDEGIQARRG